jgi:F-type H+-transporting ATPase subunit c
MKAIRLLAVVFVIMLIMATPAMAADGTALISGKYGVGVGIGLTIIGAGYGFGKIGASALEGMARQPEVAGGIRGAMIVIAALLEGATFFGLLICLLTLFLGS